MSQGKNTIFAKQKLLKQSLHNSYKTREPIIGPTRVSKDLIDQANKSARGMPWH